MYLKVAFSKIPKIYMEITILEYSFSKVLGLMLMFNFFMRQTSVNVCFMKVMKKYCHKKVTVLLYFGEENFYK